MVHHLIYDGWFLGPNTPYVYLLLHCGHTSFYHFNLANQKEGQWLLHQCTIRNEKES